MREGAAFYLEDTKRGEQREKKAEKEKIKRERESETEREESWQRA